MFLLWPSQRLCVTCIAMSSHICQLTLGFFHGSCVWIVDFDTGCVVICSFGVLSFFWTFLVYKLKEMLGWILFTFFFLSHNGYLNDMYHTWLCKIDPVLRWKFLFVKSTYVVILNAVVYWLDSVVESCFHILSLNFMHAFSNLWRNPHMSVFWRPCVVLSLVNEIWIEGGYGNCKFWHHATSIFMSYPLFGLLEFWHELTLIVWIFENLFFVGCWTYVCDFWLKVEWIA